ncbi:MAG: hypothetical protein M1829_005689 [Trizodia sp. TS-e1964]|nr:MAG: hypothetical protein M1829_005689 [Trizodia sp. TS-e1964]
MMPLTSLLALTAVLLLAPLSTPTPLPTPAPSALKPRSPPDLHATITSGIDLARQKLNDLHYSPLRATLANPNPAQPEPETKPKPRLKAIEKEAFVLFGFGNTVYAVELPSGAALPDEQAVNALYCYIYRKAEYMTVGDFVAEYAGTGEPFAPLAIALDFEAYLDAMAAVDALHALPGEEWNAAMREKIQSADGIISLV